MSARLRLETRKTVLDLIDLRRSIEGDDDIGRSIEKQLLDCELEDLEGENIVVPYPAEN